ncbi:hypothetical protein PVAP13_1KG478300 [Panicum virgatum]|uniref:Uncharacterized protein n=1 Tax=Panicum virgatum TaxID=38727 RepID=A0A8T0XMB0_PANVG|nr:hypothetical protein PVAP13_1KG478300 [Panicum virgatum]
MGSSSSKPAPAELTVALIPALGGSVSGPSSAPLALAASSSSPSAPVQPVRRTTYSVLQVVCAMFHGAPAIPLLEDGHPSGAEEAPRLASRGRVRGVVVGTASSYLRACGRIPMVFPEGSLDLNAAAVAQPPPERGLLPVPVICAQCNRGFCFGVYEVPCLMPPPGYTYPEPPVAATADLLARRPAVAVLLACSNRHHFMVTMGMLRLPHDAPSLVWRRRPSSLGVVGSAGGGVQQRHVTVPPPPPGPSASTGSKRKNFEMPGDEDMVRLSLRYKHDPLALTLG